MRLFELGDLDRGPGRALLDATVAMGFSDAVARAGLAAEVDAWRAPAAMEALRAELPPELPPETVPQTVLVIAARTLPPSTMRAVLMARVLGARVLLKPAGGQSAVADAIAAADPAVAVAPFGSDDHAAVDAAIDVADSVVVLGSDATVDAVQRRVAATGAPKGFVGYGHRVSAAWFGAAATEAALLGLAADLCAWDQAGCLSPQVVWTADDPTTFVSRLAEAVRHVEGDLPMTLPPEAAGGRHTARTLGLMAGAIQETATALLVALPTSEWRSSPGRRLLWVLPTSQEAISEVGHVLSTVAVHGPAPALPRAVRVCRPGEMQRPTLGWLHDGQPNLPPLLVRPPDPPGP